MRKPLHEMTDAEAIRAYGTEPTFYEAYGQWEDAGEMDRRYAEKRLGGMDHYAAKVQSYEEVTGRTYEHDSPLQEGERDRRIIRQYAHDQQVKNINQKHNAEMRQLKESHKKQGRQRMAGILVATALAGSSGGLIADYLDSDYL